jgi:thiol-disulfide isomerase/thioredoxin
MKPFAILLALVMPLSFVRAQEAKPADKAKGYAVGSVVADFTLDDADGKKTSLKSLGEGKKYIVLDFWSTTCPAAQGAEPAFAKLYTDFNGKGVAFVHVASNKQENKTEGDVKKTKEYIKKNSIAFPVLLDVDNKIADVFGGTNTPHVFIIDTKDMKVVYAGALNDNVWKKDNIKREHVREALTELLAGKPVSMPKTEASGCTIKRAV